MRAPAFVLHALEHHLRDFVAPAIGAFVFTRPTGLPLAARTSRLRGRLRAL